MIANPERTRGRCRHNDGVGRLGGHRLGISLLVALCLAAWPVTEAAAEGEEFDPARLELPDIIGCKLAVPEWNGFALWFHDNLEAHRRYGMTPVEGGNPFLSQYHLTQPVTVFGRTSSDVAFTSSGLLGIFDGVSAHDLADQLGIGSAIDFPGKFMGEKVIAERPFDGGSPAFQGTERITLNVSTVSNLPGKVLAGCSYRINFPD